MGWKQINIRKYVAEVKRHMNLEVADEIIAKDLLLTLILAEFQKEKGVFNELIFKGGTLLSRNYLKYHRFSEDLDFVHKDSNNLRVLSRKQRERKIKLFIDIFMPKLKKIADLLELDFSINRSDIKYCTILSGRTVYIFRVFYSSDSYIKIEINFVEEIIHKPIEISVKAITDFFDSKELLFVLGLSITNFRVQSYPIREIILEKYRAILTRPSLKERDIFDLYLISDSLNADIKEVVEKIISSFLIKKELNKTIKENLKKLEEKGFFRSDEKISDLAIVKYDMGKFEKFKYDLEPILIKICEIFLDKKYI